MAKVFLSYAREDAPAAAKCPVLAAQAGAEKSVLPGTDKPAPASAAPYSDKDWWPNQLNLQVLNRNSAKSDPMGEDYNYADFCVSFHNPLLV